MGKLTRLRAAHPKLDYTAFSWQIVERDLEIRYEYKIAGLPRFIHQVNFANLPTQILEKINEREPDFLAALDQFAFALGIDELFSYWKLTSSPIIKISARPLIPEALSFWQKLLIKGMSEYFYVNKIDFTAPDFVNWEITPDKKHVPGAPPQIFDAWSKNPDTILLGFGGGKDSLVTARLLAQKNLPLAALVVEPASPAAQLTAQNFQIPLHLVTRRIDPQLLALNQETDETSNSKYFNGHVPFSASLAFIGNLCQLLYACREFVVSNEQSACEVSTTWLGQPINHQYSKSGEFENDFNAYCHEFLSTKLQYSSYLRNFYELKIAQLFTQLATPQDLSTFRSCNVGQKQNIWCEKCSKCLFVFLMLFPFLDEHILTTKVFSHNLFEDETLIPILDQLAGLTDSKPLECVGMIDEVRAAGYLAIKKYTDSGRDLPVLLKHLEEKVILKENSWAEKVAFFLAPAVN